MRVDSHSGFGANDPAKSVAQLSLESGGDTLSKLAERCANGKNLRSQQRRVEQPQLHLHRHEAYHPWRGRGELNRSRLIHPK